MARRAAVAAALVAGLAVAAGALPAAPVAGPLGAPGGREMAATGSPVAEAAAAPAAPPPATTPPTPDGPLRFREVGEAWGLVHRHHHGGSGSFFMVETMGAGVAIFDYDGDGDDDVFFVDSGALPGYTGEPGRSALFANDGSGRFHDVTAAAGLHVTGYGMGVTAGDVDGDGDLDLYVTAFGPDQLFVNRGDGSFTDGTAAAGLGNPLWGTSAAFADADGDGDLDLYVTNYVDFSFANNPVCGERERGLRSYCHPDLFAGLPDRFYRNVGGGRFEDATAAAGFGVATGKGLGVVWSDLDADGRQDLYVANDMTPNLLFHNRGAVFAEMALESGTALSDFGRAEAGMGVEATDLDGNLLADLVVTHLDQQTNAVYLNQGDMLFVDGRYLSRLAEPSLYKVGFGVAAADLDADGDPDLVVANGHIIHNVDQYGTGTTYRQPNQVFRNRGNGVFEEAAGAGLDVVRSSRGLAVGDLDGDGDLDLVITNNDDRSEVYENLTAASGGWLQLELRGAGGNSAGVGTRLVLDAGGRRQLREARTASSYLSQGSAAVHFGFGAAGAGRLEARWPGGKVQVLVGVPPGHRLVLFEPR